MYSVDPHLPPGTKPRWRDYFWAARRGLVPGPNAILPVISAYYKRSFHPSQLGGVGRAVDYWLDRLLPGRLTDRRAEDATMTQSTTQSSPVAVTASDGVRLAVHAYTEIDPRRPTILAIHGYPDNHHVWDGVAENLSRHQQAKYNFVAYDVRGAGESSTPADRSAYLLPSWSPISAR